MWKWMNERAQMPRFVWIGVLLILVAIAYQIFMAKSLLINLQDRTLQVARAEASVAEKEKKIIEVADQTLEQLERLKAHVSPAERDRFTAAQMTLRDDVKRPVFRGPLVPPDELFGPREAATK